MTGQDQPQQDINNIIGFFRHKKYKYVFVVLDDERLLNVILEPVIEAYQKKGQEILHFLLKQTDYYIFQQIERSVYHGGLQGIIVSGLNELIDEYGDICIDNLNRSRDAFQKIDVPIIWIIDHTSLQKIIRGASDFYQMRHLPDFHIQGDVESHKPLLDINFFYNPYPGDKDIDTDYLEKRLRDIPPGLKHEKETINGFVIPLLRRYIDEGNIEAMKNLFRSFLKGHEDKVQDTYILVSYYTAIDKLHQGPFFPKHFGQPFIPFSNGRPDENPQAELLEKDIKGKKGIIVASGIAGTIKSPLVSHTLGKLEDEGFDFIIIYGETTPEMVLFYTALKAREKNDQGALEIFSGKESIEEKMNYFIDGLFSRNKIALVFIHFEENQSESAGGECTSRRLRFFLNRMCESLKGKDSFLFISTNLPLSGFFTHRILDAPDNAVIGRRLEELTPLAGRTIDVLSIFRKPVRPDVLRFYDLDPENLHVLHDLQEAHLLQINRYKTGDYREEIRLVVPPFVSHLVEKRLDGQLKRDFHLRAGQYFENYLSGEDTSYLEKAIDARRHLIAAAAWDKAAESTLKLFWPLHEQNFIGWAMDLLTELLSGELSPGLRYHVHRRLGLLHYYRGGYIHSWDHYREALVLVTDEAERYRLYSEILSVEGSANPGFNPNVKSIFKGIFHSLPGPPPLEIIQLGPTAILSYFKEAKQETTELLECKIFIVGNGEVGKTTLMKKLIDPKFKVIPGEEPTTHAIHIVPWQLDCTFPDGQTRNLRLHFWDFGGQDIYHATHQFFLTQRSLYLFVWEVRREEETRSFDYWLNIVKLLSVDSPVIVVMNKADLRTKYIDEAGFKKKFPNIQAFCQVSCLDGRGIRELTEHIRDQLAVMPHLLDRLPRAWADIKKHLEQEKEKHPYISRQDYDFICKVHGLDKERADFLSGYLHDLGIILHFRHDPLLENTVILNPEWATEAVYVLIDTRQIQENRGSFVFKDLEKYWDEKKYPASIHRQLVRLLETFELCFNFAGTEIHFVPELLPPWGYSPDISAYLQPGTLRFQYHYDFMPVGIVSRFMARVYYLIHERKHFWKNGMVLAFEGSLALVQGEPINRRVTIAVTGACQRELLAIIRSHFDTIHESLNMEKNRHFHELVPCICEKCRQAEEPSFYEYDKLKEAIEKNVTHIACFKSFKEVSVEELLARVVVPKAKHDQVKSLITAAGQLQGLAASIRTDEDSRTGFIAQLLTIQGFIVKDHTRWGWSATGKSIGQVDMKVEGPDGQAQAIIEAFILRGFDRIVIANHVTKIFAYDVSVLEHNFLLVYAEAADFAQLWQKYLAYLPEIDYPYPLKDSPEEINTGRTDIRLARTRHDRHGQETLLYHLFVNMHR